MDEESGTREPTACPACTRGSRCARHGSELAARLRAHAERIAVAQQPEDFEWPDGADDDQLDDPDGHGERSRHEREVMAALRATFLGPDEQDDDGTHVPAWLLRSLRPSSELNALLEELSAVPSDEFTSVEIVAAFKRLEAYAAAGAARAASALASMPSMDGEIETPVGKRMIPFAAAELAMRLTVTRGEATDLIAVGKAFTGPLAETAEALERGEIDMRKATTIIKTLSAYPDAVAWQVQAEVLPDAGRRTHRQLVQDLNRAVIGVDPHDAELRRKRASTQRHVTRLRPLPHGQASMTITGPAEDVVAIDVALQAGATSARAGGDARTTDQLRFDAAAAMAHHALATGWIGQPPDDTSAPGRPLPRTVTQGGHPDTGTGTGSSTGRTHRPMRLSDRIRINVTVPFSLVVPEENFEHVMHPEQEEPAKVPVGCVCASGAPPGTRGAATGPEPPGTTTGPEPPGTTTGPEPPGTTTGPEPPGAATGPEPPLGAVAPAEDATTSLMAAIEQPTAEVAEIAGIGPVTPAVARLFALGGTWRRIITDPLTGLVHDVGRTTYRPPAELARYVRERDRTCVLPGCSVPADRCQLDHELPWALGGATASWNLEPLCDRDHPLKTSGGFRVERGLEGVYVWTAPSGHRYRREADGTLVQLAPKAWPDAEEEIPF